MLTSKCSNVRSEEEKGDTCEPNQRHENHRTMFGVSPGLEIILQRRNEIRYEKQNSIDTEEHINPNKLIYRP